MTYRDISERVQMNMEERREALAALINNEGTISFANIKKHFSDVSEMTLRTDLKTLDQERRIVRIHGGARSVDYVVGVDGLQDSHRDRNVESKTLIAQKAAKLVRPNSTIFVDSGSTTEALCNHMPNSNIQVFASNIPCILALSHKESIQTYLIGGKVSPLTLGIRGSDALIQLQRLSFDQTFLGVSAYQHGAGFSCGSDDEAAIKRYCTNNAGQVIALLDSSKIDYRSTFHVCDLEDIDIVVGDDKLPPDFLAECHEAGIEVL